MRVCQPKLGTYKACADLVLSANTPQHCRLPNPSIQSCSIRLSQLSTQWSHDSVLITHLFFSNQYSRTLSIHMG